ncbi:MAG: hypothetical protein E7530_08395 [Ruminococcaceae bacterium]|nr:hypothetical protein [Oscillospiraceae bacterium]
MKERKSFLFYYDWFNVLKNPNYSQVGRVVMAIEEYEKSGIEPQFRDSTSKIAFTVISNTLIRDAEKYEKKCLKNAENARKRWDNNANVYERINENANYADKERDKDKDKDKEKDTDRDIEKDSISSSFSSKTVCEYSDDFLDFWKEYPKKVGKGDAFKKWKKAKLTNTDKTDIMNALNWQKKSDRWRNDYGRFIPNPSTYISQRRWEDEPDLNFNSDITDPSRYTDGDTLPDFILRGDY